MRKIRDVLFDNKGDATAITTTIVRVAALLIVGVALLNGVVSSASLDAGTAADQTFVFSGNPATDGKLFTVGDDTYEFDPTEDGVVEGNIAVVPGVDLPATLDAILVAAAASGTEAVTLTEDGTDTLTVTADATGTAGNAITTTTDEATATAGGATLTGGVTADSFYALSVTVIQNIESGYTLAALMVLALGAAAIMRYMGFM